MNKLLEEKQLESLRKLAKDVDFPIVVEGMKDKRVLSSLGFKNIYTISGKSPESVAKLVSLDDPKSVVILTDFDREGEKYFKRLVKFFHSYNIKVDNSLRKRIKSITAIQKIEELAPFLKSLEQFTFT